MRFPTTLRWLLLSTVVVLLAVGCLVLGTVSLASVPDTTAHYILLHLRLPALLMALSAGIALSLSGLTMQTVMGNPLADPSLLGVTAGASLGAAVAIMLLGSHMLGATIAWSGMLCALALAGLGAMAVTLILVACSSIVRQRTTLLLIGVMLNFLISSIVGVLYHFAATDSVKEYVVWGLGSLHGASLAEAIAACCLTMVCTLPLCGLIRPLNALLLGEGYATAVGYSLQRLRTTLLLITCLLTALITALCGPIAFIGLAVPHAARAIFRTSDHAVLIPACILLGAATLMLCHLLCMFPALVFGTGILPISTVTPLMGAPVVLWFLLGLTGPGCTKPGCRNS